MTIDSMVIDELPGVVPAKSDDAEDLEDIVSLKFGGSSGELRKPNEQKHFTGTSLEIPGGNGTCAAHLRVPSKGSSRMISKQPDDAEDLEDTAVRLKFGGSSSELRKPNEQKHFIGTFLEIPGGNAAHLRVPSKGSSRMNSKQSCITSTSVFSQCGSGETIFSGAALEAYQDEIHLPRVSRYEGTIETVSRGIIAIFIYLSLLAVAKTYFFVPWDAGFALVMLWTGSMIFGMVFKCLGLPQLLGMLCAGILLKNAVRNEGRSIVDLPEDWAETIRSFGLVNILMRGGLEMDLDAVKRIGMSVVWLTVVPGVTEAFVVSGLAVAIFKMPFFLALAFGFTLAAVSPAIVVGGMFDLQAKGYGVQKGIPTFVVAAASLDDVVAISGFSMFIGLAVGSSSNIALLILGGPVNILVGFALGAAGGIILSWTRIWNTDWKRSLILVLLAVMIKFGLKNVKDIGIEFDGAGALAALLMAFVAAQMWHRGWGGVLAFGIPDPHFAHIAESHLCLLWKVVSEPLLFSLIGSALDFSKLKSSTIPLAGLLLVGCVAMRTIMASVSTHGAGLNFKERMFVALAWMPKASVQAALGAIPLSKILENKADEPNFEEWKGWGLDILTTAVFSIILTAPLGLLVIQNLGPKWLEKSATIIDVS